MVEKEFQNLSLKSLTPFHLGFRVVVDKESIGELAETVKTHGMLEPLIVRPSPTEEGKYEVVCGLRRLRAAEEAGLENVPCIVAEMSDEEAMEAVYIENEQRENVSDYERGRWLKTMIEKFPGRFPTQEVLAKRIGKSQELVSRLIIHYNEIEKHKNALPPKIMTRVIALPEGVVREVRRAPPDVEPKILEKVAEEGLSVRETAALVNAVATRQVSVEEGLAEIKAEAPKKVAEAEEVKRAEHALFEKLTDYYPVNLLDEIMKRTDIIAEEKLRRILKAVIDAMWSKLQELGLIDEVLQEARRWSSDGWLF